MSDLKSMEDIYGRLLANDEPYISAAATGIIFKILPNATWNNMQAFWGVLVIYLAVFSCVYFIKRKVKQHKDKRHYTVIRMERKDAC